MRLAILAMLAAQPGFAQPVQSIDCSEQELLAPSGTPMSISGPIYESQGTDIHMQSNLAVIPSKADSEGHEQLLTFHRVDDQSPWLFQDLVNTQSPVIDVSLSEDLLVVGESKWSNPSGVERGRVRIYRWNETNLSWGLVQTIVPPYPGAGRFGGQVAQDGDWLMVTSDTPGSSTGGPAFLYRRDPQSQLWSLEDEFASPVGLVADELMIEDEVIVQLQGSKLNILRRDPSSGDWLLDSDLPPLPFMANPARIDAQFVEGLLLVKFNYGDLTIVVYEHDDQTGTWSERQLLLGTAWPAGTFGSLPSGGFSASADQLLVGSAGSGGVTEGLVLRYARNPANGNWVQDRILDRGAPAIDGDRFGARVATFGQRAIIMSDLPGSPNQAWALDLDPTDCDANGIPDSCEMSSPSADRNGDGVLDICQAVGQEYCDPANPNSSGLPARIVGVGSSLLADGQLEVCADQLPPNEFGYLLASSGSGFIPLVAGSAGNLCLAAGPDFGRYSTSVGNSGPDGVVCTSIGLPFVPTATGPHVLQPGETWYFQYWTRDGLTSNHTSGLEVLFE